MNNVMGVEVCDVEKHEGIPREMGIGRCNWGDTPTVLTPSRYTTDTHL